MLMRYHSGLGVGHVYGHRSSTGPQKTPEQSSEGDMEISDPEVLEPEGTVRFGSAAISESDSASGSEHNLDRDNDSDSTHSENLDDDDDDDDDENSAMDEMYGSRYFEI